MAHLHGFWQGALVPYRVGTSMGLPKSFQTWHLASLRVTDPRERLRDTEKRGVVGRKAKMEKFTHYDLILKSCTFISALFYLLENSCYIHHNHKEKRISFHLLKGGLSRNFWTYFLSGHNFLLLSDKTGKVLGINSRAFS